MTSPENAYERERLQRIERNNEKLKSLGLKEKFADLFAESNQKRARRKKRPLEVVSRERSTRLASRQATERLSSLSTAEKQLTDLLRPVKMPKREVETDDEAWQKALRSNQYLAKAPERDELAKALADAPSSPKEPKLLEQVKSDLLHIAEKVLEGRIVLQRYFEGLLDELIEGAPM